MKNTITYKGYVGSVEFSEEDNVFFGKVMGIRSLISYEGTNGKSLVKNFHDSIDEYLKDCEKLKKEPEAAYKGTFNVRIKPELHKQAVICAMAQNVSLNNFVEEAVRAFVAAQQ